MDCSDHFANQSDSAGDNDGDDGIIKMVNDDVTTLHEACDRYEVTYYATVSMNSVKILYEQ